MIEPLDLLIFGVYGVATIGSYSFILARRVHAYKSPTDRRRARTPVLVALSQWITSLMFGGFLLLSVVIDVPDNARFLVYMGVGSFGAAGVIEATSLRRVT